MDFCWKGRGAAEGESGKMNSFCPLFPHTYSTCVDDLKPDGETPERGEGEGYLLNEEEFSPNGTARGEGRRKKFQ